MIQERLIDYEHDGITLEGYMAWDDAAQDPRSGVMLSHAWGGRGDFDAQKARDLAQLGYVGFALDLYGKGNRGNTPEENAALMQPFLDDRVMLQSRMTAALATFSSQPEVDSSRIACMGFCFGGLCVLDLARTGADIAGVISLHGFFTPPGNTEGNRIKAKVLAIHGNDDPMVPKESIPVLGKEMTTAGVDWQIHIYGNTKHAFTNPEANDETRGTVYNATADKRSWQACVNFLGEILA